MNSISFEFDDYTIVRVNYNITKSELNDDLFIFNIYDVIKIKFDNIIVFDFVSDTTIHF